MRLRCAFLLILSTLYLTARAADVPSILVLGDEGAAFGARVERVLTEKMLFFADAATPGVKYVCVGGVSEAAGYLCAQKRVHYRVLLVCCRDSQTDLPACRRLADRASQLGMELLWMGCDGGFASHAGICLADYEGFCHSQKKDSEASRCEYIAEAAAQWWTGIARSNRGIERVRLWDGKPPHYEYIGGEYINALARIDRISEPELELFLPHQRKQAPAVVFFPGGGYSFTGFLRNARELAEILTPRGIAVIGLKYRTKRGAEVAFEDAQRAIRLVRSRAQEWGIDPGCVGIAGQSAGAHLTVNLATRFTAGDPDAEDLVERLSSRPDFAAPLTVWNFGSNACPFVFDKHTPPFFVRQARNDSSFALAENLVGALQDAGVAVDWRFVDTGGHGAFEIESRDGGHNWPQEFEKWLRTLK